MPYQVFARPSAAKTSKIINGRAKVTIKSERLTPFGDVFHMTVKFDRYTQVQRRLSIVQVEDRTK